MNSLLTIEQQQRKSLSMVVTSNGVKVLIPCYLDPVSDKVQQFISKGMSQLQEHELGEPQEALSKKQIRRKIFSWARRLGVEVKRVQIRPMKNKWGSVSSQGNLTIADDVLSLPEALVDYLIVHELAHLKFSNHGKGFQLLMDMTIPDWRKREMQLAAWMLGNKFIH